ncbi:MAG TPA: retroviral-like aspartic protease family protein [Leptolyngbyaceae cyanobacterium M33_DOE_097]|uniref:Peptidase A2 domain-containing protein n=1 Tax=Oscillatoriales cyanobacterium SpSt-418 TaxID=2282169 RepID=A0A7C3PJ03_9CYAN|nr:retroviral-like aspartic protease family protein [Leptolyngbyaceae cyanobacterium M33_DOE_097]
MSASPSPIKLAQQGDPTAIAQLLNQALQAHQVAAKVIRKDGMLRILLEAAHVPDQIKLVPYLEHNFKKLAIPSIHTIELQAKQASAAKIAWNQKIILRDATESSLAPATAPATPQRSKSATAPSKAATQPKSPQRTYQIAISAVAAVTLVLLGASIQSAFRPATRAARTNVTVPATPNPTGVYTAPIVGRVSGIPVIMVRFNGLQEFPMMVDTGASGTLITPAMASALAITPVQQIEVQTPSGFSQLDVGYITSMEVDGVKIENQQVAIGLPHMELGLLGHDFFGNLDVTVRQEVVEFRLRE